MSINFNNKTVFISGASSGIGLACAHLFAKAGARLILLARREDNLRNLATQLKSEYNAQSLIFAADICEHSAVEKICAGLTSPWSEIDVLINNAGLALGKDKVQAALLDDWEKMIDTNIKGLLYLTHALLPNMLKRNQGHIINLGSISGRQVYIGGAVYCATKHAVKAFSDALRLDLSGNAIRVSCIEPGMVETEFSQVRFKGDTVRSKQEYIGIQALTPVDIADAIFYCASRSAHVNIQDILITPTAQASASLVHRESKE
jgi:3-hydroxy acid dehydrogenase/malonic semialdehyde reductase